MVKTIQKIARLTSLELLYIPDTLVDCPWPRSPNNPLTQYLNTWLGRAPTKVTLDSNS